jgi:hypothetical protein
MENDYATIELQVLTNLLAPASTRKKVPHSIFATRLLYNFFFFWESSPARYLKYTLLDILINKIIITQTR